MVTSGKQRYIPTSARKIRRVIDTIRGKHVLEAYKILQFMPYKAAKVVLKKLVETSYNALNHAGLSPEEQVISKIVSDEGPSYRRFRPRAQGRIYRREKQTAHLLIEVTREAKAGV
jgi:large subunit ribosomal protein L22